MRWLGTVLLLATSCASPRPRDYTETVPGTTVSFDMIRVGEFWIGRTEVTWDEYELFYLGGGERGADATTRPSPPYEPPDRGWGRGRRPAINITRHAAEAYCAWLSERTGRSYRLPTEAEWELACGDGGEAWHRENADGQTHEVGLLAPNARRIHDMLGNVAEWVAGTDEPTLRGGSWQDGAGELRSKRQGVMPEWSQRDPQRPRSRWWFTDAPCVGFRVAASGPPR